MSLEARLTNRINDIQSEDARMTDEERLEAGASVAALSACLCKLDPEKREDRLTYGALATEFLRDTEWVRDRRRE